MATDFCEHLDEYGVLFGRAGASYQSCLALIDKLEEDPSDSNLCRLLEKGLDEWVLETRNLRNRFKELHRDGGIELLNSPKKPKIPTCPQCGFQIPRLEFPEFQEDASGQITFRGKPLSVPEIAKA